MRMSQQLLARSAGPSAGAEATSSVGLSDEQICELLNSRRRERI